jgi:hypothetical protein
VPSGHYSKSPDDAFFRDVALTYASNHEVMKTGAPQCPGEEKETFPQGITNGAQWYDVPGRFMRQFVIPTFFLMSGYRSSWKSASNSRWFGSVLIELVVVIHRWHAGLQLRPLELL